MLQTETSHRNLLMSTVPLPAIEANSGSAVLALFSNAIESLADLSRFVRDEQRNNPQRTLLSPAADAKLTELVESARAILGRPDAAAVLQAPQEPRVPPRTSPAYVVIQEGGSSDEIYVHSHESLEEAEADRVSCAEGAYNTSEVLELPADLAAHGEVFYEFLEKALAASLDMSCPDVPSDGDDPVVVVESSREW